MVKCRRKISLQKQWMAVKAKFLLFLCLKCLVGNCSFVCQNIPSTWLLTSVCLASILMYSCLLSNVISSFLLYLASGSRKELLYHCIKMFSMVIRRTHLIKIIKPMKLGMIAQRIKRSILSFVFKKTKHFPSLSIKVKQVMMLIKGGKQAWQKLPWVHM